MFLFNRDKMSMPTADKALPGRANGSSCLSATTSTAPASRRRIPTARE